jgi:uncharacterized protein (DUF427 family)
MANPAPGYATKPEHRVDLLSETKRLRVTFAGTVIADSAATLRVEETGHGPVHYFPAKDVRLDLLRPTEHHTYCPFKGDCSYWTIALDGAGGGKHSENAVWAYRAPYDEAVGLADHYAFYKSRVDAFEEL